MSEDSGFTMEVDSISEKLSITGPEFSGAVVDIILDEADYVREYAQSTAPWVDRSGMARDGLDVDVYEEGDTVNLALFHTVDYGLWLEVIQSGRYAVIMPTLEALAPQIFRSVNAEFTGIQGES